ncbi:MAG TPA: serine/threonine-protein kinase [Gemmatimonadaceae bacterium]|nr:serine/threonine-protein kinase [Gemmatimonadaceae bacterium]
MLSLASRALRPAAAEPFVPTGDAARERIERDAIGRALGAQYQLVRLLGRGGMGAVYLARDRVLHRVVAIKVLLAGVDAHDARERFRREARLAAQLAHPNVVPLYAFGETPELQYMVMQYVHGESLAERLRREGRLDAREVRRLLATLALTLEHAHRHGIVHRDLKPENILLERDGDRPMLVDFGVAILRSWDTTGGSRNAAGTPRFMSPEQLRGDPDLDGRSDLYALGVLGYLMLASEPPFSGRLLAAQHLAMAVPSLAERAPWAPADLVLAIERCLAKEPAERWGRARDLHDALTARGFWRRAMRLLARTGRSGI